MLVDEYQVTFWTRGQYPAAPPRDEMNTHNLWVFLFIKSLRSRFRHYGKSKIKRLPARNSRFRGVFAVIFVFGPSVVMYNFFTQELPL